MGIDQIGKKGPLTQPVAIDAPLHPAEPARPFELSPARAATAASAPDAPTGAIAQLRSGKLSLEGYLDLKVAEATSHLSSLAPAALEAVRSTLRERLATDPTLVDLVRAAAGELGSSRPPE
ncbi:MAG: hypothetical protein ABSC94_09385 [Polyangiaceae bacterium]|jgi:hypothetical protein